MLCLMAKLHVHQYIHQKKGWTALRWDNDKLMGLLGEVRLKQGRLLGKMEGLGFRLQQEAHLRVLTDDVVKTSDIEGEVLPVDQVRSSVARRLGLQVAGLIASTDRVDGVVEMMVDATSKYSQKLTQKRLFRWHVALFPTGNSGARKVRAGKYRDDADGPMEVVSGAFSKRRVHFVAPKAQRLAREMKLFLDWFNNEEPLDPVLKAALAHLWFVTLHPFDDGNGRIARAIADMQLARSDGTTQRFYSMSNQIRSERKVYYDILEKTQSGEMDVTPWMVWFLQCLERALEFSSEHLTSVLGKAAFWEKHQEVSINDRQRTMLNKMMGEFFGKLNTSKYAKMMKISQDTAHRDIMALMELGMLEKEPGGGRSTTYRVVL